MPRSAGDSAGALDSPHSALGQVPPGHGHPQCKLNFAHLNMLTAQEGWLLGDAVLENKTVIPTSWST
jgi:hypothetical protein